MDPFLLVALCLLVGVAVSKRGRTKATAVFGTLVRGPKGELLVKLWPAPKKRRRKKSRGRR